MPQRNPTDNHRPRSNTQDHVLQLQNQLTEANQRNNDLLQRIGSLKRDRRRQPTNPACPPIAAKFELLNSTFNTLDQDYRERKRHLEDVKSGMEDLQKMRYNLQISIIKSMSWSRIISDKLWSIPTPFTTVTPESSSIATEDVEEGHNIEDEEISSDSD